MLKSLSLAIFLFLLVYLGISAQPILTVTANDLGYDGLLFLTPGNTRCALTDLSGNVLFEYAVSNRCFDFKRLDNGDWIYFDSGEAIWKQYAPYTNTVKTTYSISGYDNDTHDIIIRDDYVWLMGRQAFQAVTGTLVYTLRASVVQKQDWEGNILFNWNSKDYIALSETMSPLYPNRSYPHSNSFYEDIDGNLIVSFNQINSVIKVCVTGNGCQIGEIIWRLGGLKSNFAFINDRGFAKQHSASMTDVCHGGASRCLLLFDNGNDFEPQYSRAVEFELNEAQGTVTKTWEYTAGGKIYASFLGNVKRLLNGDTVIGWGSARGSDPDAPTVTVVDWEGDIKYEAALPPGEMNYRAHLYPEWRMYLPLTAR